MRVELWLAITLGSLLWLSGCSNEATEPKVAGPHTQGAASVISLDEAGFAAQIEKGVVLVDFWASWCGPCKMQAPIMEEVAGLLGDKARIAKLDVDAAQGVAKKYGISSIPTLIVFKDGKPVKRFQGLTQADALKDAVMSVLVEQ